MDITNTQLGFSLEPMPLVGVVVNDLDAAIAQYSRVFGLDFHVFEAGVDYGLSYELGGDGDTSERLPQHPRIGFDTANHFELMEMPNSPAGLRNVHYRVDSMDVALVHFAEQGLTPVQLIRVGNAREAIFDSTDLGGLRLVLVEFSGESFAEALAASPTPA